MRVEGRCVCNTTVRDDGSKPKPRSVWCRGARTYKLQIPEWELFCILLPDGLGLFYGFVQVCPVLLHYYAAGRYLFAICSSLIMIFTQHLRSVLSLTGASLFVGLIGIGLLEATAIQFWKMLSDQLSTFIHWYYWSCNLGHLVILYIETGVGVYFSQCTITIQNRNNLHEQVYPFFAMSYGTAILLMSGLQLVCACVGLCLLVCSKRYLNID